MRRRRPAFVPGGHGQRHRFNRYLMATGASLTVVALIFVASWGGLLEPRAAMHLAGLTLGYVALFYALFRTGLNRRTSDPSLTFYMVLSSLVTILLAVALAERQHEAMMFLVVLSFVFGVFRLTTREWLALTVLVSAAYALILFYAGASTTAGLPPREKVVLWVFATVVFLLFSLFGGYISKLRLRLATTTKELRQLVKDTREQANRDALTGAYNRRYMTERLNLEAARAQRYLHPLGVCLADIDHFKRINDTFGHPAGDAVLRALARLASSMLRPMDLFGRFGGEEFLLVLPETDLRGSREVAERLRRAIAQLAIEGLPEDFRVTLSGGVAQYRNIESVDAQLKRCDEALYRAKEQGRNRVEVESPTPVGSAATRAELGQAA